MKILISDVDQGHGDACKAKALAECPTATVTVRLESLAASITWAINQGNIDIISRSTTGLSDYRDSNDGQNAEAAGIGIVHAHGSNSHIRLINPSKLGYICAVGAISGEVNGASYGPGLEFFNADETTQSYSTARTAGIIGQFMIDHPAWTFHDSRQALRQTAGYYATAWIEDGGYGKQNKTNAGNVTIFELSSPVNKDYTNIDNKITLEWKNNLQSDFNDTVIAIFNSEPSRTQTPTALQILYAGQLETFAYNHGISGNRWFVFYTRNTGSDYSKIESNSDVVYWFDKVEVILSTQVKTDPPFNGTLIGNQVRMEY